MRGKLLGRDALACGHISHLCRLIANNDLKLSIHDAEPSERMVLFSPSNFCAACSRRAFTSTAIPDDRSHRDCDIRLPLLCREDAYYDSFDETVKCWAMFGNRKTPRNAKDGVCQDHLVSPSISGLGANVTFLFLCCASSSKFRTS
jgi:hypothetical protein